MELDHTTHITRAITITKRKEICDWCIQQFGPLGETWSYSVLPGTYAYQKYDYAWGFILEEHALQFSLTWC